MWTVLVSPWWVYHRVVIGLVVVVDQSDSENPLSLFGLWSKRVTDGLFPFVFEDRIENGVGQCRAAFALLQNLTEDRQEEPSWCSLRMPTWVKRPTRVAKAARPTKPSSPFRSRIPQFGLGRNKNEFEQANISVQEAELAWSTL